MVHTYTTKGNRRYRYYVCASAQQKGWSACPSPSVPAAEIERFVVDEIRGIGRDPDLVAATLADAERLTDETIQQVKTERASLMRKLRQDEAAPWSLAGQTEQLADVENRLLQSSKRCLEIKDELDQLTSYRPTLGEVSEALAQFDGVWNALSPQERRTAMKLLVDRIDFDGEQSKITLWFRSADLLTQNVVNNKEVSAA